MDNLRKYLNMLDPNDSHYLGRRYITPVRCGKRFFACCILFVGQAEYCAGGPGVILSRGALRRLRDGVAANKTLFDYLKDEDSEGERYLCNRPLLT